MTELEKIVVAAVATGVVGYFVGLAHMWARHRREDGVRRHDDLKAFGEEFLAMRAKDKNLDYSAEKRLGALQRLGAYRFNRVELERFRKSIVARGLPDPLCGHANALGHLPGYPLCVFEWATNHCVDLEDEVAVLEALIADLEKQAGAALTREEDQQIFRWQLALEIARGNR